MEHFYYMVLHALQGLQALFPIHCKCMQQTYLFCFTENKESHTCLKQNEGELNSFNLHVKEKSMQGRFVLWKL